MPDLIAGKENLPRSDSLPVKGELLGETVIPNEELQKQWIKLLSIWTDTVFEVPGLGWRFGLDPIIGLVPIVGDAASALVSFYILSVAAHFQVPRSTLARMMLNVAIDYVVGAVPVVGNLFDFAWKANYKNAKLLESTLAMPLQERRRQSVWDWALIALSLALLVAAVVASLAGAVAIVRWIGNVISTAA